MVGGSESGPGPAWVVVMNRKSGTAARGGADEIEKQLADLGRQQQVKIRIVEPGKLSRDDLKGAALIIAAGGDGTIAYVAGELANAGKEAPPMAVLPLGTFNNFAKSIALPATWEECLTALPTLTATPMDVGWVQGSEDNGRVFLNVVTMGVHPAMVKDRDARLKEKPQGKWLGKWPAMIRASWTVLQRFPKHRVTLTMPGKEMTVRTPGIYVCRECGKLATVGVTGGEAGMLAMLVGKTQSRLGSLWLMLRAAIGQLPGAEGFEVVSAESIKLSTRIAHHIDLAVDGEHIKVKTPVDFGFKRSAIRVLMPSEVAG